MTLGNCLFGPVRLIKNSDLINMDIVVMVLGSMRIHNFHYLAAAGAKKSLFLVLIIVFLCMLIIKRRTP